MDLKQIVGVLGAMLDLMGKLDPDVATILCVAKLGLASRSDIERCVREVYGHKTKPDLTMIEVIGFGKRKTYVRGKKMVPIVEPSNIAWLLNQCFETIEKDPLILTTYNVVIRKLEQGIQLARDFREHIKRIRELEEREGKDSEEE